MHSLAIHQLNVLIEREAHQASTERPGKVCLPEQSADVPSPKTVRSNSAETDLLKSAEDQAVG